jgi:hypothetical protein
MRREGDAVDENVDIGFVISYQRWREKILMKIELIENNGFLVFK